jgi:dipeptidyl aminopeptidase/acylaminoacyl peptidase
MPSFTSGGKQVSIDHFAPTDPAKSARPAVIVVHGSGGGGWYFEKYAREFTATGCHVFIVHYFESTGTDYAVTETILKHFPDWQRTLADAVKYAAEQPGVDAHRIALLGISLGAYLSLAVAAQDDRVCAVVDIFGGMPKHLAAGVNRLPPTLILHGDADPIVPVSEAYELERILKRAGAEYQMKIFRGEGHRLSGMYQLEAGLLIAGFLKKHLRAKVAAPQHVT